VDAIRDRTDIAEVIGRRVKLTRRGNSLVGLCPFHQEKTPSFHVIPGKDMYYCFGCQAGGDVFKFLTVIEGLSFVEAVKELAAAAGVTVEERELSPVERQQIRRRASAFELLDAAAAFFESNLWTGTEGATARDYLERRDIHPDTSRRFRLGWAPAGWTHLIDHLHKNGFSAKMAIESGVARESQQGRGPYDAFRERVIVPIRDDRGRVIAFGGRLLQGDGPKYINSPETPFYEKSKVLYGLDLARAGIQKRDRALVVEGYFDVISLHQAGFTEAVATCGTALTREHLRRVKNLTRQVIVLLDADEAGSRAAARCLPLFVDAGVQPFRVQLQGGKDPDELLREHGPEAMEAALEQNEPLVEWVLHRKLDQFGYDAMGKERALDELAGLLSKLPSMAISRAAAILAIPEAVVRERVRHHRGRPAEPPRFDERPGPAEQEPPTPHPRWRPDVDIVHLLWLLVHRYDQIADLLSQAHPSLIAHHPPAQGPLARLLQGEPVAAVIASTEHPKMKRTLSAVVAREHLYTSEEATVATCGVLARLHGVSRRRALARLTELAEQTQREKNWDDWRKAAGHRAEIIKLKSSLKAALSERSTELFLAHLADSVEAVGHADEIWRLAKS